MRITEFTRYYRERVNEYRSYASRARPDKSILAQLVDIIVHRVRINTHWVDYYLFEFYKPGKTWEEKSRYVSKGGSRYYLYENNSVKYLYLFNNKLVTKTLLAGFGLPQPKLIATIGDSYEIRDAEQFASFLNRMDCDLVLKPVTSSSGEGVLVLSKDKDHGTWRTSGEPCKPEEIWRQVGAGTHKGGYLVEERMRNTDQIAALYPHSLNTVRVITIKTADGRWRTTVTGAMRIGSGGRAVDNLGAGGIMLSIDRSGTTFQAYDFAGSRPLTHHPNTGAPLVGITIDGYQDALDLGLRASEQFGFMGLIGWDIALTDRGPLIVEGNAYPDSHRFQRGAAGPWVTEEMARVLKERRPFARWDKTKIYPKFNHYRIRS